MYIKYIHKQDTNTKGLNHIIHRCACIHPYQCKGLCIQVATMFIFKININRIQKFPIILLTSQFIIKNSYKTYSKSSLKLDK